MKGGFRYTKSYSALAHVRHFGERFEGQSAFLTSLAGFFPAEGAWCSNNILNVTWLLSLTLE